MSSTVQKSGYRHTQDIDLDGQKSAGKWESLATVCISRARDALIQPTGTYTKVHRDTISDLLRALLVTQGSIGKLLEGRQRKSAVSGCASSREASARRPLCGLPAHGELNLGGRLSRRRVEKGVYPLPARSLRDRVPASISARYVRS